MKQEPTQTRPAVNDDNPPATTQQPCVPAPEEEPCAPGCDDENIDNDYDDDVLPPPFPVYARRSIWDC